MQTETNTTLPSAGLDGKGSSKLSQEFHNILTDIEDMVKATTSMTGEDLSRAKAEISQRVAAVKHVVDEIGEDLGHRARRSVERTNHYVHEQPWQAIGAGAALGFLLGFVLARRA
ncbi:MAG: hypothetical protein M0P19_13315 [Nevskia sp.]|nr:hypothetical protein [Nevskia sp.]MCK9384945.1 hypothetical protein [Nevskia sp.]